MPITDTTLITRSLAARKFSSVTTVAVVALGVALMLVLLSMKDAGRQAFDRGRGNMHVLISGPQQDPLVTVLNSIFYSGAPRNYMFITKRDELLATNPLAWAIPTQLGDSYRGLPVMATTPAFFTDFQPAENATWQFIEGRSFDKPFEIVIGAEAAEITGLAMGDRVSLTHGSPKNNEDAHVHEEFVYEVVGVLAPTATLHDRAIFSDLTSSWTLHAHDRRLVEQGPGVTTTPADLIDEDKKITGLYARILSRPGRDVSAIFQSAFNGLRSDPTITVAAPKQEIDKLFRIVGNIDQIIVALAATVLVVGAITVMLVLYQAMEQRRRQIAVMRVLGCTKPRIFSLIITESAIIGAAGALVGTAVGLLAARIVADILYQRLGLVITPGFDPRLILGLAVATIALAATAGLIPAVAAYRTAVIKNLRPTA